MLGEMLTQLNLELISAQHSRHHDLTPKISHRQTLRGQRAPESTRFC